MNGRLDILGLFHGRGHSICRPRIPADLITLNKPWRERRRKSQTLMALALCVNPLLSACFSVLRDRSRAVGKNKLRNRTSGRRSSLQRKQFGARGCDRRKPSTQTRKAREAKTRKGEEIQEAQWGPFRLSLERHRTAHAPPPFQVLAHASRSADSVP